MSARKPSKAQKPRELRRRVVVAARLRHGVSWTDTCILNVSARGLMIYTAQRVAKGSEVEICHGDTVIVAQVMWREGARAGLKANEASPSKRS